MSSTLKWLIAILVILVLGLGSYIGYPYAKAFYLKKFKSTNSEQSKESTPTNNNQTITHVSDPGVTWLSTPVKLVDLGLIKNASSSEPGNASLSSVTDTIYYRVATLNDGGAIILAMVQLDEPGSPLIARFKLDKDGKYSYLLQQSFEKDEVTAQKYLTDKVNAKPQIDSTTIYQSLTPPAFLKLKDGTIKEHPSEFSRQLFSDLKSPKELSDSEYGMVYQVYSDSKATETNGVMLALKLADSSIVSYTDKFDFMADDNVALITWSDGTKNSLKYTPEGYVACGTFASDNIIINTADIASRLKEAGTTNTNEKIYTLSKNSDAVISAAYENYKLGRNSGYITLEQFFAQKPVFIYKDGFGRYVIFTGMDFAGLAECGKPVIYLYPTQATKVSVKVGADIIKSEPEYKNGWSNVLAKPNGELTVSGKVYNYLFWEGTGNGMYPNIHQGFIVKHEDLEQTLHNQLSELGLNQKESADFMEFWWPKMPDTPYVRLTWLGTKEMNQLAPLSVNPKPDTMIRIFLDFAGLNEPINIEPQHLSHPARNGFTLVEWGGLLK